MANKQKQKGPYVQVILDTVFYLDNWFYKYNKQLYLSLDSS